MNCYIYAFEYVVLSEKQFTILTIIISIVMAGNIITNIAIIHILIKAKQIVNITGKLIFMLSISDLMIVCFCQNLQTTIFYEKNCLLMDSSLIISVLCVHLSMYSISIIGIDRYLRIKHYANFKALWTTRVVLTLMCVGVFLSFFQAAMIAVSELLEKESISMPIYIATDVIIFSAIMFLQILTIHSSNALHKESTAVTSSSTNKKITKFSMPIMLLLCFFITPHHIIYVVRDITQNQLNDSESAVGFIAVISATSFYANSSANAILLLTTNVKAKRFLQNSEKNKAVITNDLDF